MFRDFGRTDLYPPVLDLINPTNLGAGEVTRLVEILAELFDATNPVAKDGFPFAGDISATGRLGAIDDSLRLIRSGHPRDALYWIGATASRCMMILEANAPDLASAFLDPYLDVLSAIGVPDRNGIVQRAAEIRSVLPVIRGAADEFINLVAVD